MIQIEGTTRGKGLKFAVVVARFNDFVTERLQAGALDALKSAGVDEDDICVIKVPGAFEIAFAARDAAMLRLYQWAVAHSDVQAVLRTFWTANLPGAEGATDETKAFATELVRMTVGNLSKIDPLIAETAENWRLSRMAALDRLILRL